MSPIDIKSDNFGVRRGVTKLQEDGSWTSLKIKEEDIKISLQINPKNGQEVGQIEMNAQEIQLRYKNGDKVFGPPFLTKPGDEVTIREKDSTMGYEINHLAPSLNGVQKAPNPPGRNQPPDVMGRYRKKQ